MKLSCCFVACSGSSSKGGAGTGAPDGPSWYSYSAYALQSRNYGTLVFCQVEPFFFNVKDIRRRNIDNSISFVVISIFSNATSQFSAGCSYHPKLFDINVLREDVPK
jgi:hypothetical protein